MLDKVGLPANLLGLVSLAGSLSQEFLTQLGCKNVDCATESPDRPPLLQATGHSD
jgi:hypothetical protein